MGNEVYKDSGKNWGISDLSEYISVTHFISRICGGHPLNAEYDVDTFYLLVSLSLIAVSLASTCFYFFWMESPYSPTTDLAGLGELVLVNLPCVVFLFSIVVGRGKYKRFIEQTLELDQSIKRLMESPLYELKRLYIYDFISFTLMITCACFNSAHAITILEVVITKISFVVPYLAFHLYIRILVSCLSICEAQLKQIMMSVNDCSKYILNSCGLIFWLIVRNLELLNSIYHTSLIVAMLSIFFLTVFNIFYAIGNLNIFAHSLRFIGHYAWVGYWFLEAYVIISSCSGNQDLTKEFNKVLFEIMIMDETDELAKNEKLNLYISMKKEVQFSACGLFTIDFTLLHSMVAAATTYLVILVQFDDVNKNG